MSHDFTDVQQIVFNLSQLKGKDPQTTNTLTNLLQQKIKSLELLLNKYQRIVKFYSDHTSRIVLLLDQPSSFWNQQQINGVTTFQIQLKKIEDTIKSLKECKTIEVPIFVEKFVQVDRPIEIIRWIQIEKPVQIPVEREVLIEVEKIVEVEKPVIIEKEVEVQIPVFIEKQIQVEKPIFIEKYIQVQCQKCQANRN